jgi:hypothetical protein
VSKLEAWQRYRKATPCPICGGYGAYKPENRCKGFLKADGSGAYCSSVADGRSALYFEALGLNLYYHPFEGEGELSEDFRRRHRVGRSRILGMRSSGLLRVFNRSKRAIAEAHRPPTGKDFG